MDNFISKEYLGQLGSKSNSLVPYIPRQVLLLLGTTGGHLPSTNLCAHCPLIHLPGWTLNPGPCSTKTLCPPPPAPTEAQSGPHLHPQGRGESWPPPHNFPRTPSPHPHLRFPPQHASPSVLSSEVREDTFECTTHEKHVNSGFLTFLSPLFLKTEESKLERSPLSLPIPWLLP